MCDAAEIEDVLLENWTVEIQLLSNRGDDVFAGERPGDHVRRVAREKTNQEEDDRRDAEDLRQQK